MNNSAGKGTDYKIGKALLKLYYNMYGRVVGLVMFIAHTRETDDVEQPLSVVHPMVCTLCQGHF